MNPFARSRRHQARSIRWNPSTFGALILAGVNGAAVDAAASEFYWGHPTPQGNAIRALEMEDALTGYAVGDFGTTLRTTDGGVTWEDRTRLGEFSADLRDLLLDGQGDLLAAGSSPGIFRSTDDGLSWEPLPVDPPANLYNLFRIDGSTLSAVGAGGSVYRSLDDGMSWSQQPALGGQELVDQWWKDAQNGYVIGPLRVRATTNGGLTWQPIPGVADDSFFPGDIKFLDAQNGWILVDFTTYRTTNGGATWFPRHGNPVSAPIYQEEAVIVDASTRWVCTEAEGAEIWKTTDDGLNWTQQYGTPQVGGMADLVRTASGRLLAASWAGDLLRSDDGGGVWQNATTPLTGWNGLEAIEAGATGTCFAGGYTGSWIQSTDFGRTWFAPTVSPPFTIVWAISNRETTWYVGGSSSPSQVARSTDDGASWNAASLPGGNVGAAVSIAVPSAEVAFAATYGGSAVNYVFRTTDGGASWHLRNQGLPTNIRFFSISFLDPLNGYVGGGGFPPRLWRTTDGGATWTGLSGNGLGSSETVHDLHWIDLDTGVAVGFNGAYRTTDGGENWTLRSSGPYKKLDFGSALHGYSTDFNPIIWETTDGGVSWQGLATPVGDFTADVAATPNGYMVAGTYGRILGLESVPAGIEPIATSGSLSLVVGPNPSLGRIAMSIRSTTEELLDIRVVDVQGRAHAHWSRRAGRAGALELAWDPPDVAAVWFVRVTGARGARATSRVVRLVD